jgi:hypothetical protein
MKQTSNRSRVSKERGFVLIASAVSAVVLFGMAGLAFDIGRMYITKNEAQTYADSASLYAAQKLDGTSAGLASADNSVKSNPNAWNFATTAFDANKTIVEYSVDGATNWTTSSGVTSPATIAYVRVTAVIDNFPLFLLPATGYSGTTATIKAAAIAGQILAGGPTGAPAGTATAYQSAYVDQACVIQSGKNFVPLLACLAGRRHQRSHHFSVRPDRQLRIHGGPAIRSEMAA